MTNAWQPPPGGQPAPTPPYNSGGGTPYPQAPSPGPGRGGGKTAALAAGLIATIAATAGITYAVTRPSTPATPTSVTQDASGSASAPAADQAAAKKRVCDAVQVATRGGTGDLRLPDNQVNVPVIVRILTGIGAVQNALTPAVPPDVAKAAQDYVGSALDTANAFNSEDKSTYEELKNLNETSNAKLYAFLDVCGIPHRG